MFKKLFLSIGLIGLINLCNAQEMPKPSPMSTLMQRVGLTDITIEYSRPSVKGRTIFGELVPYGKLWRLGANASTKIEFSSDVKIGDIDLEAGKYSLFAIPGETEWTIIFNTNLNLWGVGGYKKEEDILRVKVSPEIHDEVETMQFTINNISKNNAHIQLTWDNVMISIPVEVETEQRTEKNMIDALNQSARTYRNAANYYAEKENYETAIKYADLAVQLDPANWYTSWVRAEVYAASGDVKKAIKYGNEAIALGDEVYTKRGEEFTYKAGLEKDLAEWKSKK